MPGIYCKTCKEIVPLHDSHVCHGEETLSVGTYRHDLDSACGGDYYNRVHNLSPISGQGLKGTWNWDQESFKSERKRLEFLGAVPTYEELIQRAQDALLSGESMIDWNLIPLKENIDV